MAMRVVAEVARNQAMRLPQVRARARASHTTGVQTAAAGADEMFDVLAELSPVPLAGARVLELGPGKGVALARTALDTVAAYATFDTVDYLDDDEMAGLGIDHRTGDGRTLPWPDATFDVVWSNSVLEHVRDPAAVLAETRRVLRPGGAMVAEIDLADHLRSRRSAEGIYDCLRYPAWLWDLMADHRSTWVNRLRASDWRREISAAGLDIVVDRPRHTDVPLAELRAMGHLRGLTDDDLATRLLHVAAVRPD